jgi:hypothetical protein
MILSLPSDILELIFVDISYRELQRLALLSNEFLSISNSSLMLKVLYKKLLFSGYNFPCNLNQAKFLGRVLEHDDDNTKTLHVDPEIILSGGIPYKLQNNNRIEIKLTNVISISENIFACYYLTSDGKLYMTGNIGAYGDNDKKHYVLRYIPHHLPIVKIQSDMEYMVFLDINGDIFIVIQYSKYFTRGRSYKEVLRTSPIFMDESDMVLINEIESQPFFSDFHIINLLIDDNKIIHFVLDMGSLVTLNENNDINIFKPCISKEYEEYCVEYWDKTKDFALDKDYMKVSVIKQLITPPYKIILLTFSGFVFNLYDLDSKELIFTKLYDNVSQIFSVRCHILGIFTTDGVMKLYFNDNCVYSDNNLKKIIAICDSKITYLSKENIIVVLTIEFMTNMGIKLNYPFEKSNNKILDLQSNEVYKINEIKPNFKICYKDDL